MSCFSPVAWIKEQYKTRVKQAYRHCKEWWLRGAWFRQSDPVAKFTAWVAAFTLALVVVAVLQFCSMNSADQANRDVQRAFVYPKTVELSTPEFKTTENVVWRFTVIWENSGNTPTRDLHIYSEYDGLSKAQQHPSFPDFSDMRSSPTFLAPKATTRTQPLPIDAAKLLDIQQGKLHLYIFALATYRDIFAGSPPRVTRGCWELSDIPVDVTKPRPNARVAALMTQCPVHNCTDDECKNDN
jgi:hypothetical protein